MAGRVNVGARLGAFEILALVGAGGMGEVYRARDTRLDRTVAIKILQADALEGDHARRLARFRQEARAVARITHPNICTLHDVAEEGGTTFLVMEFVEGTTLARRLEDGPLPLAAALKIAVQIAEALDHAHHHGVIHRDLKPSNIMLTRDRVKLLDFGLAKLKEPDERSVARAATETHLTDVHTVLGTAPYMAPEQVEGRAVDARTDIFAFGIVLYEMIAGRRPFAGDSQMSILAAIVGAEPPPLTGFQSATPPIVERLVRRCLAKDPEERWQTARDLAADLRWIAESGPVSVIAAPRSGIGRREVAAWGAAAALAVGVIGLVAVRARVARSPAPAVARFAVPAPAGGAIASLGAVGSPVSISPDGRHIAFLATAAEGPRRLYLRDIDDVSSRPLPGTDGALQPFWSPDSQSVGFFAEGKLRRISIAGGDPQTICAARSFAGGASWNRDGIIVFTPAFEGAGVHRVSAGGGIPTPVTKLDATRESAHLWPSFLPDGRHFVFEKLAGENTGLYVAALDSGESKLIMRGRLATGDFPNLPVVALPGYLLFVRRGVLMAQSFDLERLELTGDAVPVAEGVENVGPAAAFSVSQNGTLVYWTGAFSATQLTWVDRAGHSIGAAGPPGHYAHIALSPDGTQVALDGAGPSAGVWVLDVKRGTIARVVSDLNAYSPVWSPDSGAVLFSAVRDTPPNLFVKRLSASGDAERLLRAHTQFFPTHWAPDGQSIVYATIDPETRGDVWVMPMSGDRTPVPFLRSGFDESSGRISPDGRWIAYESDESGRYEVYVTSYPRLGRRWLVSVNGGQRPVWARDGRELYYESADRKLTGVPVTIGASFEPGIPKALFEVLAPRIPAGFGKGWTYDVAADGRFLVNTMLDRSSPPLIVVLNWPTEISPK